MKNAIIVRFDCYGTQEVKLIEELEKKNIVKAKLRIYSNGSNLDEILPNVENLSFKFITCDQDFDKNIKNKNLDVDLLNKCQKHLSQFLNLQSRFINELFFFEGFFGFREIRDDINLFYRLVNFYQKKIEEYNIEVIIFDECPHHSHTLLLYHVCQELGIKTIIFQQSIFNDRCFCISKIEDIGDLENNALDFSDKVITTPENNSKDIDLYYMNKDKKDHFLARVKKCKKERQNNFIKITRYFLPSLISKKSKRKINNSFDKFYFYNRKYFNLNNAYKIYNKIKIDNPNLNKKFVYFSLHYEPESTTLPMGGEDYYDQIRAIEHLYSRIKDKNILIYAKEHPANYGGYRSTDFYKRLKNIPNLYLITEHYSNRILVEKSLFVASITGTVIFESVTAGKPAISFGHCWCNNISGVFKYQDIKNIDEVINYKIHIDKIRQEFGKLSHKLCNITMTWGMKKEHQPKNLDYQKNSYEFTKIVKKMIENE